MHMPKPDFAELSRRLETRAPASVLAIGPQAKAPLSRYLDAHPECSVTHLDAHGTLGGEALLLELESRGRFDFVILRNVLERIDAETGAHLIARLRDVHTRCFCVLLGASPTGHRWTPAELVAMGLSYWSTARLQDADVTIHGFDLGTYKATPDWLNARHWAHPEHWGKYRW